MSETKTKIKIKVTWSWKLRNFSPESSLWLWWYHPRAFQWRSVISVIMWDFQIWTSCMQCSCWTHWAIRIYRFPILVLPQLIEVEKLQLRVEFVTVIKSCRKLLWVTNSSNNVRVWSAIALHATSLRFKPSRYHWNLRSQSQI